MSAQLFGVQYAKAGSLGRLNETKSIRKRDDLIGGDLQPGANIVFEDKMLTVNQWVCAIAITRWPSRRALSNSDTWAFARNGFWRCERRERFRIILRNASTA